MTELQGSGIHTSLAQAAEWLGIAATGQVEFSGVSSDSRALQPGNLFVALRGPNHDGHEHAEAAQARGAAALLVERPLNIALPQLVVADTRLALGQLAAAWRLELGLPLVGVTGSNGKTTVKEMVAAILSEVGPTLATRGNLNNDIGVPLTLLGLDRSHCFGVIEMGANHPGEIAYLTGLTRPDVAVVTNAGPAHLEGFGSIEGVARAKGEIYGGLRADGIAVINADDHHANLWRELNGERRTITFGLDAAEASVTARWESEGFGNRVHCRIGTEIIDFHLTLSGRHNVLNALAAIAVARGLGIETAAIVAGLEGMQPVHGRLEHLEGSNGAHLIDDTYNANPASLRAGLEVLAAYQGQRYLALGDMGELGANANRLHREAGEIARALGIDRLYATGRMSRFAAEAFGSEGHFYAEQQALVAALRPQLAADVTVLVKGSRSSHMEQVVAALLEEAR